MPEFKENDYLELLEMLSKSKEDKGTDTISLRRTVLGEDDLDGKIVKLGFDLRTIDESTYYNPRRSLQNYFRTEEFVTKSMDDKITSLKKLKTVIDDLKSKYETTDEWKDSYLRTLSLKVDNCLRVGIEDGEFSESQKSTSSLDYLKELIFNRYRLTMENIIELSEDQIKEKLLLRDKELFTTDPKKKPVVTKKEITGNSYTDILEKLLNTPALGKDQKSIERTITITIRDSVSNDED